jgi:hypothetical protein
LGAVWAGVVGELVSPRAVMWLGAVGMALQWTVLFAARRRFGRD